MRVKIDFVNSYSACYSISYSLSGHPFTLLIPIQPISSFVFCWFFFFFFFFLLFFQLCTIVRVLFMKFCRPGIKRSENQWLCLSMICVEIYNKLTCADHLDIILYYSRLWIYTERKAEFHEVDHKNSQRNSSIFTLLWLGSVW